MRHFRRTHRVILATLVALAALAAACSSDDSELGRGTSRERVTSTTTEKDSDTTETTEATDTRIDPTNGFPENWTPPELDWESCRVGTARGGECATLEVPLDWSDPAGETIELALARIPATGKRIGSLLSNPGGPGASGLEFLGYEPFSPELAEEFDLVSWDPRGIGKSTPVDCQDHVDEFMAKDSGPDDATEQQALEEAAALVAEDCAAANLDLLEHIGTEDVARDLEAIRLALGDEPLNYIGFSYGTHIGLQYAEFFGDRIRAMTLDGVVNPSEGFEEFLTGQALAFEKALQNGAAACTAAGADVCGVPDLIAAYEQIAAQSETTPLPGGPNGVGPSEVTLAATFTGYIPEGWTMLGSALASAQQGDGSELWDLASEYLSFGSYGTYAGVVCTDTTHPEGTEAYKAFADRLRAAAPHFGASIANEMLPCATWPAPATGEAAPIVAPGTPPILVVGNTGDPATPVENAEAVASSLENGHLVVVDIDGHTVYGTDRCATDIIDAYMIDLTLPAADARC